MKPGCDEECWNRPANSGDDSICRHGFYLIDPQQSDWKIPVKHKSVNGRYIKVDDNNVVDMFGKTASADSKLVNDLESVGTNFGLIRSIMDKLLANGREKALVMTKIDEAEMWAQRAVLRGG